MGISPGSVAPTRFHIFIGVLPYPLGEPEKPLGHAVGAFAPHLFSPDLRPGIRIHHGGLTPPQLRPIPGDRGVHHGVLQLLDERGRKIHHPEYAAGAISAVPACSATHCHGDAEPHQLHSHTGADDYHRDLWWSPAARDVALVDPNGRDLLDFQPGSRIHFRASYRPLPGPKPDHPIHFTHDLLHLGRVL